MESFDVWLMHRVAQAVEAGDVPADLLTELRAEFEAAREKPKDEGHAEAVRDIAGRLGLPLDQAERDLTILEAQPTARRELLMRRFAEAWLEGHKKAYRERWGPA